MRSRLFLDVHAIQTVPPANINRDDTGSPKVGKMQFEITLKEIMSI